MKEFIESKLRGRACQSIDPLQWMAWIIAWGELRGKTEYVTGGKGPSPQTAVTFFNLFRKVLKVNFNFDLIQKYPSLEIFPRKWMRSICQDKLYKRSQANFLSQEDILAYVKVFREYGSTANQKYYAKMAEVVVLISTMYTGCRLGELLAITAGQVQFMTVQGKIAVALFPGGSKTDLGGQKTTAMAFSELPHSQLCPLRAFFEWLKFQKFEIEEARLAGDPLRKLFPVFNSNKLLCTSLFTTKVQNMEKRSQANLPKFNAHSGRVTITALALFAKDDHNKPVISKALLEHQYHWKRNTETLSNYLGHNSTFAKGGFFHQIHKIRTEGQDVIDEPSIKGFQMGEIDSDFLLQKFEDLTE